MLNLRRFPSLLAAVAAAALLPLTTARAQVPGAASGVSAALIQLFGANTNFTAKAKMQVLGKDKALSLGGPVEASMLNGNFRMDLDITQLTGSDAPAGSAMFKQMGMDRLTSIIRADKREVHVVLPALEAVLTTPFSKDEIEALQRPPKVTIKELGKETLDGVAVVKQTRTFTLNGESRSATLWVAPTLKDFPLQLEYPEAGSTLVLKFSDVKLSKPAATLFEVPKGYTLYGSPEEMMQGAMKKMMGGATTTPPPAKTK